VAPHVERRTALDVILGSARLLHDFHRALSPEDIELLAAGISEAVMRLDRAVETRIEAERAHRPRRTRPPADRGCPASNWSDVRAAAKEAAFREGRRPDLQLDLEDIAIRVPATLVRKVVAELVRDAFQRSTPGMAVRVCLRSLSSGWRLEVLGGPRPASSRGRGPLAVTRRIVAATGGRLEVEDRTDARTIVRVNWPDPDRRHSVRVRIPRDNRA
jgi:hypothetical protein